MSSQRDADSARITCQARVLGRCHGHSATESRCHPRDAGGRYFVVARKKASASKCIVTISFDFKGAFLDGKPNDGNLLVCSIHDFRFQIVSADA